MMTKVSLLSIALGLLLTSGLSSAECPINYVNINDHCLLFLNNVEDNFLDARATCQALAGDLAMIKDCTLLGSVVRYIHDNELEVPEGYWIGATDVVKEGHWVWHDNTPVSMGAPLWGRTGDAPMEPQGGLDENCAAMRLDDGLYFHDEPCEESAGHSPLCQTMEINGLCPSPYLSIYGSCFEFLNTLDEPWEDARTICKASNGDLAIINDCVLMTEIINYIQLNGTYPEVAYWIGGSDTAAEGAWQWIDGTFMDMTVPFWGRVGAGTLQPGDTTATENCAELWARDGYYFNDVECQESLGRSPLCQAPYTN